MYLCLYVRCLHRNIFWNIFPSLYDVCTIITICLNISKGDCLFIITWSVPRCAIGFSVNACLGLWARWLASLPLGQLKWNFLLCGPESPPGLFGLCHNLNNISQGDWSRGLWWHIVHRIDKTMGIWEWQSWCKTAYILVALPCAQCQVLHNTWIAC
jgi:hypothetical protein